MSQLWRKQASAAYGYSLARLALNAYTYFEDMEEEGAGARLNWADGRFHEAMGAFLAGEDPLDILKELREQIRMEMEAVTAYTDCFLIYEYALNRLERRVLKDLPELDIGEEELIRRLVNFVAEAGDPALANQRIQMVIGQLPVRFTRKKFYSMVMEGLSAYIGSDSSGLENMMYLLRTSSMTERTRSRGESYRDLDELLEQLKALPFRELTADAYRDAMQKIGEAGEMLYSLSDSWQMLQEMVNDLYVLALTRETAMRDQTEEENALFILRALYQKRQDGECQAISEEVTDRLYLLEGVQESCFEKYQRLEPAPGYAEGEANTAYLGRCVDRLLSSSPFVPLEEPKAEKTVERADVEAAANAFFAQLEPVFDDNPKPVVRAIMAVVLSNLPVFFNNPDEFFRYLTDSLSACTDLAEKETCMELLLQLMESWDYGVV